MLRIYVYLIKRDKVYTYNNGKGSESMNERDRES